MKDRIPCWNCGFEVDERDVCWNMDVPPRGYCQDCFDDIENGIIHGSYCDKCGGFFIHKFEVCPMCHKSFTD